MNSQFQGQYFFGEHAFSNISKAINSYRDSVVRKCCQKKYSPFILSFSKNKITEFWNEEKTEILKNENSLNLLNESIPISELIDSPPIDITQTPLSYGVPNSGNYDIFKNALLLIYKNNNTSQLFNELVTTIIPIYIKNNAKATTGVGFSSQEHKGAIFLSEPQIPSNQHIQLAISLAHELGHQSLILYQITDTIIEKNELDEPIYSHARKCNRPAIQAFHACVAISFMSYFLEGLNIEQFSVPEQKFINNKKHELNKNLKESVNLFLNTNFTEIGKHLHLELLMYANTIE